ncbi:hypothetical protein AB0I82_21365 [Streptomyces sp. NPDC050315]
MSTRAVLVAAVITGLVLGVASVRAGHAATTSGVPSVVSTAR